MRSLSAVPLLLVLACGDGTSGPGSEPIATPPRGWSIPSAAPIAPQRYDDVTFLDRRRGWVVSTGGQVFRTRDGGGTWAVANQSQIIFRSIAFVSEHLGWAGNLNFTTTPAARSSLYETRDGGTTWTNISDRITGPEPAGICGMFVINSSTVYAVGRWNGPAVFIRTRDGGQTWRSVSLEPHVTGLIDLHFFDEMHGVAVGGDGVGRLPEQQSASRTVILATDDGGDTWRVVYRGTTTGKWAWKISFPTRQTGYVSTQGPTPDGAVLKTTDGGQTWQERRVGDTLAFSGIGFATSEHGWVASDTLVHETRDGGLTWTNVRFGQHINRFRFFGDSVGFAVGKTIYWFGK
jgi:photosystem II stability/assembly factor-like uncharacterized protein